MKREPLSAEEIDCLLHDGNRRHILHPIAAGRLAGAERSLQPDHDQIDADDDWPARFVSVDSHDALIGQLDRSVHSMIDALAAALRANVRGRITEVVRRTINTVSFRQELANVYILLTGDTDAAFGGWLAIETNFLFAMLDRMLGGAGDASYPTPRPLTAVERRLAARVAQMMLSAVNASIPQDIALHPAAVAHEMELAEFAEQTANVLHLALELRMGEKRGLVQWCMPEHNVGHFLESVASSRELAESKGDSRGCGADSGGVRLVAELKAAEMDAVEVANLQSGSVIPTELDADSLWDVLIDGRLRFRGGGGVWQGKVAVRLQPLDSTA